MMAVRSIALGLVFSLMTSAAQAAPLLLISIDGLRPGDVIEAEMRGLKIPNLRRFLREGSFASGVVGVTPTVTYPSHTTLLTGVSPAKHGVVGNTTFDPTAINQGGWYWYASDIKAPTLWDGAKAAGMSVANVHWPVSVGASSITYNLPQIWRTGHGDDAKLVAALSTPGLLAPLEADLGPYAPGIDESIEGDETRGKFAVRLITQKKPGFTTVYLTAFDHEQHAEGPGSAKAHAIIERIDAIVGRLVTAAQSAHKDVTIAVVSDHGFSATDTEINLFRAFIDEGLITLDAGGKVKSWDATPWNSGGSSAIILARAGDAVLASRVDALLAKLKADPAARIDSVAGRPEIAAMGANPSAHAYVSFAENAYAGGFKGKDVPLAGPSASKGMHGYFRASPSMRSTFMMMGPGVAKAHNLGEIDMRSIAPTLAKVMEFTLLAAEREPLP
jgi:predicted AlkP superfamily pyrophosphatase or phosphodiesterase